jgi:hypothetical protein
VSGLVTDLVQSYNALDCLHLKLSSFTVTDDEFSKGLFGLCDLNRNNGVKHPLVTSTAKNFYLCENCQMVMCKNCKDIREAALFLILLPMSIFELFSHFLRTLKSLPRSISQFFSNLPKRLQSKYFPGLDLALENPPKPHTFTNLPLQSSGGIDDDDDRQFDSDGVDENGDRDIDVLEVDEMTDDQKKALIEDKVNDIEKYEETIRTLDTFRQLAEKVEAGGDLTEEDKER